jgi:6-phosphogluconolactonase
LPRPFDVTVLGMGDDGHTASLFPRSPNLPSALNASAAAGCVGMRAPSAPQARLSLNLSALLDSRRLLILIIGDAKWRTFTAANAPGPVEDMPVRAVLRGSRAPVEVVWAP